MTTRPIYIGQSRVVGFFVIYCLYTGFNVIRGAYYGASAGVRFVLAQCVFICLTGTASWYLYQSKKAGWYLSLIVVSNWFLSLIGMKVFWNAFAILVTVGMVAVLTWLFRPSVTAYFDV